MSNLIKELSCDRDYEKSCTELKGQVKFILYTKNDYEVLQKTLEKNLIRTTEQKNYFFDGLKDELRTKNTSYLRIRVVNGGASSITLKYYNAYQEGTAMTWETKVELSEESARKIANEPNTLFDEETKKYAKNPADLQELIDKLKTIFGVSRLVSVGVYHTHRGEYKWNSKSIQDDFKLNLDYTRYPFDKAYELEVTDTITPVYDVEEELKQFLVDLKVDFKLGEENKFQRMFRTNSLHSTPVKPKPAKKNVRSEDKENNSPFRKVLRTE